MKIIKTYKLFETMLNLDSVAKEFIGEMSKVYDLRLGMPFNKDKANCAWFTEEFYNWAKSKGYDVKIVYFDSDIEAHIAPLINEMTIDFTVKQFTKNPNDNYLILSPEDYQKFGYDTYEIYDYIPKLETVFPADKISESTEHLLLTSENGEKMYGIYDWIEDIKSWEWSRTQHINVNRSSLKQWSNKFIGDGWFDKIDERVERIFAALQKVDVQNIEDRMLEVWDELPSGMTKWIYTSIAYGNAENFDKEVEYKYNGLVTAQKRDEKDKLRIIIHILKEVVFPTLYIGSYPNMMLRQSDESYYVTDPKWQCQNFNIDDYQKMGIKAGAEFDTEDFKSRKTFISEYDIKKKKDYSIDKIIEMYVPCVVIDIGRGDDYMKYKIGLDKLESKLDEILPSILPTLDYTDVIFDMARGRRQFENQDVHDYTVKILLNF